MATGAASRPVMQSRTNYGFTGGLQNAAQRGSNLVMMATNDVTAETSNDDKEENLLNKPKTQDEINKEKFKPAYAYFVLFITLCARIMVQW